MKGYSLGRVRRRLKRPPCEWGVSLGERGVLGGGRGRLGEVRYGVGGVGGAVERDVPFVDVGFGD